MLRSLFTFFLIVAAIFLIYWIATNEETTLTIKEFVVGGLPAIHFGNIPLRVEVANTDEERSRGLSGKDTLPSTQGMLFVFSYESFWEFWMRGVRFPIDIIWIDSDFHVVDILPDLGPETYPNTYRPRAKAQYVVETNAGFTEAFGIRVGDSVDLSAALPRDVE